MSDGKKSRTGRKGDGGVRRGQVVSWDGGGRYRVVKRRAVDGLAMLQTDSHEVYLESLDGGLDPEWVPENEVEPAGE